MQGSEIPVASGMAIQVDVIPQSRKYFSTRMEDGLVIADAELRSEAERVRSGLLRPLPKETVVYERCARH